MTKKDGKFKLIKKTKFSEIDENFELPESDLCFQNEEIIAQFEYIKDDEEEEKYEIKPGMYTLVKTTVGVRPKKTHFRTQNLLESVTNTQQIMREAKIFFSRLDVYEKLGRPQKRGVLLYSSPGMGKCLGKDTPVLMYDGTIKMVQHIKTGDVLMGPDSRPRNVLSTVTGKEKLYKIIPNKGDPYVVNESHILSLRLSGTDELHNISVRNYLHLTKSHQERLKGWRSDQIDFDLNANNVELIIDPYFLGLWLGDGTSSKTEVCTVDSVIKDYICSYYDRLNLKTSITRQKDVYVLRATSGIQHGKNDRNVLMNMLRSLSLINNKHIPLAYKTANAENRLALLAGLIDSDGSLVNGTMDICFKNKQLAEDAVFVARSLGFAAYINSEQKICTNSNNKAKNTYYRFHISGDVSRIPTKLLRKQANERRQIKNVRRTGITVEPFEHHGDYYGFEIDGDKLFLLSDFTVTHNTSAIAKFSNDFITEDSGTVVFNWPTSDINSDDVARFLSVNSEYTKDCTRLILVIEDIGGGERENLGSGNQVDSGLLNLLDGVDVTFKLPTFIVATTNHPENLLGALADRPGRFDLMLKLESPTKEEKIKLTEFIAKRELTDEEKAAFNNSKIKEFSIAHLEEIVVRSLLHDKTIPKVIDELVAHRERFHKAFNDRSSMGMGINR